MSLVGYDDEEEPAPQEVTTITEDAKNQDTKKRKNPDSKPDKKKKVLVVAPQLSKLVKPSSKQPPKTPASVTSILQETPRPEMDSAVPEFDYSDAKVDPDTSKLYVKNIPPTATESDVLDVFKLFGVVTQVTFLDRNPKYPNAACLVQFQEKHEAVNAIASLNRSEYFGKQCLDHCRLVVEFAVKSKQRLMPSPFAPPPKSTIFVKNIPAFTSNEGLKAMFAEFGTVVDAHVVHNKDYGFVSFTENDSAQRAIKEMDGKTDCRNGTFTDKNRPLVVAMKNTAEDRLQLLNTQNLRLPKRHFNRR